MILSNTSKIKYRIKSDGKPAYEVAMLLRDKGVKGFVLYVNDRSVTMRVPQDAIKSNRKIMEGIRNGIRKNSK